ncbi:hypothetical protein DTL70_05055 [Streptomyces diacarni]|uniref:Uncharacterized protein n=1 Tax=Streptomyces diacarni TaxID=2800381 RepID=A0A367FCP2_9ACTN|nr:hypothetical protein DTL70_05055 [Streptomyces diacarni]
MPVPARPSAPVPARGPPCRSPGGPGPARTPGRGPWGPPPRRGGTQRRRRHVRVRGGGVAVCRYTKWCRGTRLPGPRTVAPSRTVAGTGGLSSRRGCARALCRGRSDGARYRAARPRRFA